jgi:hypothetical protein
MRRTQARQCDLPMGNPMLDTLAAGMLDEAAMREALFPTVPLASLHCRLCGASLADGPEAVIALGRNDSGAVELTFCSIAHSIPFGFPWLARPPERQRRAR